MQRALALSLALTACIGGCYRSHERAPDGSLVDASMSRDGGSDGGRDAAPLDAGPPELTTCDVGRDTIEPRAVWATTLVRSFDDLGSAELPEVQALPSGGVIVATAALGRAVILRRINERDAGDLFCVIARYDAGGELLWRRELDGCTVIDLGVAADDSICVLGSFREGADLGGGPVAGNGLYALSMSGDGAMRGVHTVRGSGGNALDIACDAEGTVVVGAGRGDDALSIDERRVLPPSTDGGGWVARWDASGALVWAQAVDGVAAAVAIAADGSVRSAEHGAALEDGALAARVRSMRQGDGSTFELRTSALRPLRGETASLTIDELELTERGHWLTGRFRGELELGEGVRARSEGALENGFVIHAPDVGVPAVATLRSSSSPLYLNLSALGDAQAIVAGAYRGEGSFAGLSSRASVGTDVFVLGVGADGAAMWLRTFADEPSARARPYVEDDERWRAPADVSARSDDEIYVAGRFLSRIVLGDCALTGEEMNSFLARLSAR